MADANFEKRVQRLIRTHEALERGHIATITADGRVVLRPSRSARLRLPLRGVAFALAVLLIGKAVLLHEVGPDAYAAEISQLVGEGATGALAAWVAEPGAATLWLTDRIAAVLP